MHPHELSSAHAPVIESAHRSTPVVVIALIVLVETIFGLKTGDTDATVIAGRRVLNSDVRAGGDRDSTPVVPISMDVVNQDVIGREDVSPDSIDAGVCVLEPQSTHNDVLLLGNLQRLRTHRKLHRGSGYVRSGWRPYGDLVSAFIYVEGAGDHAAL